MKYVSQTLDIISYKNGQDGQDGHSISAVTNYYYATITTTETLPDVGNSLWKTDPATTNFGETYKYLWNYEVVSYSNGTNATPTTPTIIGTWGRNGADGKGIKTIEEFYLISDKTTCVKPNDNTLNNAQSPTGSVSADVWYTLSPATTITYRYLWNCERITYTDDTAEILSPCLIGTHGEGTRGASVVNIVTQYALSETNQTAPDSGWTSDYETIWGQYINNANYKYIWLREETNYDTGDPTYSTPRVDNAAATIAQWCVAEDKTLINGANIATGTLTADHIDTEDLSAFNATLGGWELTESTIQQGTTKLDSGQRLQQTIGSNKNNRSPVRFSAGITSNYQTINHSYFDSLPSNGSNFTFEYDTGYDDVRNCTAVIEGIDAPGLNLNVSVAPINNKPGIYAVTVTSSNFNTSSIGSTYAIDFTYEAKIPNCKILDDGSVFAKNAQIEGTVNASQGKIGNLFINGDSENSYISSYDPLSLNPQGYVLNNEGIIFKGKSTKLKFDKHFFLGVDSNSGLIKTEGPLVIQGENSSISLDTAEEGTKISKTFNIYCNYYSKFTSIRKLKLTLKDPNSTALLYDVPITINWASNLKSNNKVANSGEVNLTWSKNSPSTSPTVDITFTDATNMLSGGDDIKFTALVFANGALVQQAHFWTNINGLNTSFNLTKDVSYSIDQEERAENIIIKGNLIPTTDAEDIGYNLGSSTRVWSTLYCQTNAIDSSDRNLKHNINSLSDKYSNFFDSLHPVSYKFNKNQSNRTHIGLIAQEVEESLTQAGLTSQDFGGLCYWDTKDGNKGYGLRYGEFIALCINEIQQLKKRIAELEEKNTNE